MAVAREKRQQSWIESRRPFLTICFNCTRTPSFATRFNKKSSAVRQRAICATYLCYTVFWAIKLLQSRNILRFCLNKFYVTPTTTNCAIYLVYETMKVFFSLWYVKHQTGPFFFCEKEKREKKSNGHSFAITEYF